MRYIICIKIPHFGMDSSALSSPTRQRTRKKPPGKPTRKPTSNLTHSPTMKRTPQPHDIFAANLYNLYCLSFYSPRMMVVRKIGKMGRMTFATIASSRQQGGKKQKTNESSPSPPTTTPAPNLAFPMCTCLFDFIIGTQQ
mmetsp:Transcript_27768/g.59320  ORF Transcript_27768/g.59320 Transcript_27768/m.59320 type:complete len:140 (-) Transcript_27768:453-872(-)